TAPAATGEPRRPRQWLNTPRRMSSARRLVVVFDSGRIRGASRFLLLPGLHALAVLLQPELHHPTDQLVRNGLVEGELQVPLLPAIPGQLLVELLVAPNGRIDPDVLLKRGKVDQIAVQGEGGHRVADLLLGLWRRLADRQPDLLQDRLHLG